MKKIFSNKKVVLGGIVVALLACIVISICFLTNPMKADETDAQAEPEKIYTEADVINDYMCEQIGFGGMFTLAVSEDGTFHYYEGLLSSYFGTGKWQFENNKLTLLDEGTGKIRKAVFRYEDGDLLYCQQDSDEHPFTYIGQLDEGTRFIPKDEADEAFYEELDRQQKEQAEELARRVREAANDEAFEAMNSISLKKFVGQNVQGTLYVDWEKVKDELIPNKIWIENRENKNLWECDLNIPEPEGDSFYLCWEDGNHYVIRYNPQGVFEMFTVDESGNKIMKCSFSANEEEDREQFDNNVKPYLKKAESLVECKEE